MLRNVLYTFETWENTPDSNIKEYKRKINAKSVSKEAKEYRNYIKGLYE